VTHMATVAVASVERERASRSTPRPPLRRQAVVALSGAAVAGTLAESALRNGPPGAGLTLAFLVVLATLVVARGTRAAPPSREFGAYTFPVLFALLLAGRASPALVVLNGGALLVSLALLAHSLAPGRRWPLAWARPLTFVAAFARSGLDVLFGAPRLAAAGYAGGGRMLPMVAALLRAALIALPVVGVFALLLASADPVFERWLDRLLRLNVGELVWRSVAAGVLAWAAAGYLRTALLPPGARLPLPRLPRALALTDVVVLLGTLDLLFAAFVAVQLRHLFGGADVVSITPGLTFADYARRGFFELVAVTALAVPLLLVVNASLARSESARRTFRWLAAPMVALLLAVVLSALRRMQLYQAEFGLTLQRVVATALILWVAVVLVLFAATVLRGRARGFAWRALLSGAAALLVLNAANPEVLVVRTNVRRAGEGRALDVRYLARLSADAAPALYAALPRLVPADACAMTVALRRALPAAASARDQGWQSWSVAAHRARVVARRVAMTGGPERCAPEAR